MTIGFDDLPLNSVVIFHRLCWITTAYLVIRGSIRRMSTCLVYIFNSLHMCGKYILSTRGKWWFYRFLSYFYRAIDGIKGKDARMLLRFDSRCCDAHGPTSTLSLLWRLHANLNDFCCGFGTIKPLGKSWEWAKHGLQCIVFGWRTSIKSSCLRQTAFHDGECFTLTPSRWADEQLIPPWGDKWLVVWNVHDLSLSDLFGMKIPIDKLD